MFLQMASYGQTFTETQQAIQLQSTNPQIFSLKGEKKAYIFPPLFLETAEWFWLKIRQKWYKMLSVEKFCLIFSELATLKARQCIIQWVDLDDFLTLPEVLPKRFKPHVSTTQ